MFNIHIQQVFYKLKLEIHLLTHCVLHKIIPVYIY